MDSVFQLDIKHLNLSKYTSMIARSELRDDLDSVTVNYSPKEINIEIKMPALDFDWFRSTETNYKKQ